MTKLEVLTLLYSLESVLDDEDSKKAQEKALDVIRKVIREAENNSARRAKQKTNKDPSELSDGSFLTLKTITSGPA